MEFRNLKKNIKRHIHTSTTHKKKKLDEEQEESKNALFRNKNFKAGMNVHEVILTRTDN